VVVCGKKNFNLKKLDLLFWFGRKNDFRAIQRKIPQKSNFGKNWDSNPVPHREAATKRFQKDSLKSTKNQQVNLFNSGI
jgi:hypothetical protein